MLSTIGLLAPTNPQRKKKAQPDIRTLVNHAMRRLSQPDRVTVQAWLRSKAASNGSISNDAYSLAFKAIHHPRGIATLRSENQKAIWKKQDETAEKLEALSAYVPWAKTVRDLYLQEVDPSKLKAPDLQKKYGALHGEAQRLRKELAKKVPDYIESNAQYEAWKRQRAQMASRLKTLDSQGAALKAQLGRHGVSKADSRRRREGTLEHAMAQVDHVFGGNISPEKRSAIKGFLLKYGGWNKVDTDLLRAAVGMAAQNRYGLMKAWSDPQKAVDKLGFDLREYSKAKRNKERFVPTLDKEGRLLISTAEAQMKRHLGLTDAEIRAKKPYGEFFKATYTPYVSDPEDRLTPWQEKIASMMPDDGLAGFLQTPAIALQLIPDALQDVAGQAMGFEPGQVFTIPEIQDNIVGRLGKAAFHGGKYFIPVAGQVALGSDAAFLTGRIKDVGVRKAAGEAWEGIVQSANLFDPNLTWDQRLERGLTAGLLALGLTHGAVKAYRGGQRGRAAMQLAKSQGISQVAALKRIMAAEAFMVQNLKHIDSQMRRLGKGFSKGAQRSAGSLGGPETPRLSIASSKKPPELAAETHQLRNVSWRPSDFGPNTPIPSLAPADPRSHMPRSPDRQAVGLKASEEAARKELMEQVTFRRGQAQTYDRFIHALRAFDGDKGRLDDLILHFTDHLDRRDTNRKHWRGAFENGEVKLSRLHAPGNKGTGRRSEDIVRTLIHEIAHYLDDRFITQDQRDLLNRQMYVEKSRGSRNLLGRPAQRRYKYSDLREWWAATVEEDLANMIVRQGELAQMHPGIRKRVKEVAVRLEQLLIEAYRWYIRRGEHDYAKEIFNALVQVRKAQR